MSTEHQQFSTDNQMDKIRSYAELRGFQIVRTYADEGKSGLTIAGRPELRRLLADVERPDRDFQAILVYDVSRFGRFQDTDEAASHELRCRRAGVAVHYCAEQFENDGSIGSSIIKTVKRAMAGEYSRELSVKVFAGQANLIRLGFRQGGSPGIGLRRVRIDASGKTRGTLEAGEHKCIATDRVILVPGPEHEIALVREIYTMFVRQGITETHIAEALNARGVLSDLGRAWSAGTVHRLLTNEKYIGNNVWARTSYKLKLRFTANPPDEWIRAEGAFEPIVPQDLFDQAQAIIKARTEQLSNEQMLEFLQSILKRHGTISTVLIDRHDQCPSTAVYRRRFGGLLRAYAMVGFVPSYDYRHLDVGKKLRALFPAVVADVTGGIGLAGGRWSTEQQADLLRINREFTAAIAICRCVQTRARSLQWKVKLDKGLDRDLTILVRMDPDNEFPLDYFLLPRIDLRETVFVLHEFNGLPLDGYRRESLDCLFEMTARRRLKEAA